MKKTLSFGLFGYRFKVDDDWVSYKNAYGKTFRVYKADIDTVSVDEGKRGKGVLKIAGKGTTLASVELPKPWAYKAQEFIRRQTAFDKFVE